jgi:hypothetical protein
MKRSLQSTQSNQEILFYHLKGISNDATTKYPLNL